MEKLTEEQIHQVLNEARQLELQAKLLSNRSSSLKYKVQEDLCEHTKINKVERYYSGGYDYKSSVVISEYCEHCGKLLKFYDDPTHQGTFG